MSYRHMQTKGDSLTHFELLVNFIFRMVGVLS